jgi:hypothetical protein
VKTIFCFTKFAKADWESTYQHRFSRKTTLQIKGYWDRKGKEGKVVHVLDQLITMPWRHMEEWDIAPPFLTRWRWVIRFTPLRLYPRGKNPRYPLYRRLSGPQVQSGREKSCIDRPACIPFLYQLNYPVSCYWDRSMGNFFKILSSAGHISMRR